MVHKKLINETKSQLHLAISAFQEPLISACEAHNSLYGNTQKKAEFEKIGNFYRNIKDFIKNSEETLLKVNKLAKDYDSLFTQPCSISHAAEIIFRVNDLSQVISKLKTSMVHLNKIKQDSRLEETIAEINNAQQEKESQSSARRRNR